MKSNFSEQAVLNIVILGNRKMPEIFCQNEK